MSHWLDKFFSRNTDGSLIIREGSACHHQTNQGKYVYLDRDTVLDTFYHVKSNIAKYTVICESNLNTPHKLDTFEITVISNGTDTTFTVYGRVYTHHKLVDITIEQDNTYVYLKAREHNYNSTSDRVKVSLIRTYVDSGGQG